MNRRELLILLDGTATAVRALDAAAQQPAQMQRIGVLMSHAANDAVARAHITTFQQALKQLGWIDGHNLRIGGSTIAGRWGISARFAEMRRNW